MAHLKDVMAYLLSKYPHKSEQSKARVTKMVYLFDWKHVLKTGHQSTNIEWYFDNYGPYVNDVVNEAKANPGLFSLSSTENMYGTKKTLIELRDGNYIPDLSDEEKRSLDHVVETTKNLNWSQFISLVYSTYPVVASDRYGAMDLPQLAHDYMESDLFNIGNDS